MIKTNFSLFFCHYSHDLHLFPTFAFFKRASLRVCLACLFGRMVRHIWSFGFHLFSRLVSVQWASLLENRTGASLIFYVFWFQY